ncbi:hypothetical protein GB937_006081 [Aspergillus fischeri]|nr:hypothetical protein GB937_006081 [Aspergillus fischeri]
MLVASAGQEGRKINLVRIAHVYYTHQDLNAAHDFLIDFGFHEVKRDRKTVYYGGTGPDPFIYCAREGPENQFGGAAFEVESKDDLEYAAESLPGATEIYELTDAPGGGLCVTFRDPADGFLFHLVYGQGKKQTVTALPQLSYNLPNIKNRPANLTQRFQPCEFSDSRSLPSLDSRADRLYIAPAPVHKLGHFGMCVTNFAKTYEFYTRRFNFAPSDIVHDDAGRDITTFLHLDRGDTLVDHHCFFFFEGPEAHVHHSSYETHDFDIQNLGHDWLRKKGYKNCWGVGRHIMGSQIFDYWFDTSGFIVEHYVDGDLVNSQHPLQRSLARPGNLHDLLEFDIQHLKEC